MTDFTCPYPPDHIVFSGGRYLKAIESLDDIDNAEYSILVYLGSLVNFKESFIGHDVYPAIASIAKAVKLSESTVRKKLRALSEKGYIKISTFISINSRGKWQQRSNNYQFTTKVFRHYQSVKESEELIDKQVRRHELSKENYPQPPCEKKPPSPPADDDPGDDREPPPPDQPEPKSLSNSQLNSSSESPSSWQCRGLSTVSSEVREIRQAWEEVVGLDVSRKEEERFARQYARLGNGQAYYLGRIVTLAEDAYLRSRAKSMMFLFKPFDLAGKNKREIQSAAARALDKANSKAEVDQIVGQLPNLVTTRSLNFSQFTASLCQDLFGDSLAVAKHRFGKSESQHVPNSPNELAREISAKLMVEQDGAIKSRLTTILEVMKRSSFDRALDLYSRHFCQMEGVAV
ncbi:MAG: hypothetical protein ACOH5I_15290 [Oligoflexus sp.]